MAAPSCEGVYLIHSATPRGETVYKIGRSCDISRRMKEYGPTWEILCCHPHDQSDALERFIIDRFRAELTRYANQEYFRSPHDRTSVASLFLECISRFSKTNAKTTKGGAKGTKAAAARTPLHDIRDRMKSPDWPNIWKYGKKDFRKLVEVVAAQARGQREVDRRQIKEMVYDLIECIGTGKGTMDRLLRSIYKLTPRDIPEVVVRELMN